MGIDHELNHYSDLSHQVSETELRLRVYTELSHLLFEYHNDGIDIPKKDMEKAVNWFMEKFYEGQ